jgi:hypothetical protein
MPKELFRVVMTDSFVSVNVGRVATEYHNYCINPQVLYKNPV